MDPFLGEIRLVPYTFAPLGWAFCAGQLLPISQNTALFSLLGTTYGGDGKSTFALPNLQDSVPMHPGQGAGLSLHDLGEQSGVVTNSPKNFGSIHFGQRDIQNDDVGPVFPEAFDRFHSTRKFHDLVLVFQYRADNQAVVGIVVNHGNLSHSQIISRH